MKKKILLLVLASLALFGCESAEKEKNLGVLEPVTPEVVEKNPIVTMKFKDYGEIKIELLPNENVYNTVSSFVNLVQDGFYDDNYINRVQKGFVIQGGAGKEINYSIKGEFTKNGVDNKISHEKGVISMARTDDMDSAGGQFFITLDDAKDSLDGSYAAFGKVIEGMEVLDKIAEKDYEYADSSMGFLKRGEYIKIEKATVETYGHEYKLNK